MQRSDLFAGAGVKAHKTPTGTAPSVTAILGTPIAISPVLFARLPRSQLIPLGEIRPGMLWRCNGGEWEVDLALRFIGSESLIRGGS